MSTNIEEEYMYMLEMSWDHPVEQVNHVIFKTRKVNDTQNGRHTRANHEYHMKRWGRCVYCEAGGEILDD